MKPLEIKDPLTGEMFLPKRSNQLFKTAANRNKFNNNKAKAFRRETASINKALQKNLNICKELLSTKNEAIFHKEFLLGKGMNFAVYTNYFETGGERQIRVYNFLLTVVGNNQIKIAKT